MPSPLGPFSTGRPSCLCSPGEGRSCLLLHADGARMAKPSLIIGSSAMSLPEALTLRGCSLRQGQGLIQAGMGKSLPGHKGWADLGQGT